MVEVDLHLHTTFSDGTLSPVEVVKLCEERNLKVISITDHDSTEGIQSAWESLNDYPELTLIPGIELSTDIPGSEIHLLGYYVDYQDMTLQRTLEGFRTDRKNRSREMVKRLDELGIKLKWERVLELSGDQSIGRPHIAQAMVEAGYIRYPREAFDRYIGRDGLAYVERPKLTPEEAVHILVDNGALPVLAHPTYTGTKSDRGEICGLSEIIQNLKRIGLVGMEVYYGDYTYDQVEYLQGLAKDADLIPCGGSDYHCSGNPGEPEPGSVGPPMESFEALRALRG